MRTKMKTVVASGKNMITDKDMKVTIDEGSSVVGCQDQELFRYILYIHQVVIEDKITQIPPFHRIWNLDIDGLELKPSHITIEDEDIFNIRPSDMINLLLSKVYEGNDHARIKNLIQLSTEKSMEIDVPVNVFDDDTSANRSKKWNPINVWTLHGGIPAKIKMANNSHHFLGVTSGDAKSLATP
ncbi:uncharacterized protein LOC134714339 [Mytilus trossulus]|uniref:uncharacterized protein LOC134714339 n=1 Tax=Mytilus trossulus TaxID=6551 RepID=UPI003003B96F